MNRIHTALAVAALCGAFVAWQLSDPSDSSLGSTTATSTNTNHPTEITPQAHAAVGAQGPDTQSSTSRRNIAEMQANVAKDCTWVTHYIPEFETGEIIESRSCEPNNPEAVDPYTTWDNETLANMAYGDAHAAEVLGLRHIRSADPNEEAVGLNLIFRSVALSGDLNTFRKAIGVRYAYMSVDGEPQVDNMRRLMLFSVIGEALGDDRFNATFIASELTHAGVPENEIDGLRSAAMEALKAMASLQTEMTGDSWMQEALDNV